jgi:WD40 repeat protein
LRTIQGFNKELPSIRFVSTSDNVIVAGGDTNVLMRNAANGGNVRNYGGSSDFVYSVDASDDGKTIVAGGQDGVMRIWQENGQVIAAFEPPKLDGS